MHIADYLAITRDKEDTSSKRFIYALSPSPYGSSGGRDFGELEPSIAVCNFDPSIARRDFATCYALIVVF
jgi:hypothetical protein